MNYRNLRLPFLLTFTLGVSVQIFATNYYVAPVALYPNASDANAGTSLALPFATWPKLLQKRMWQAILFL